MANDQQQKQDQQQDRQQNVQPAAGQQQPGRVGEATTDGLKDKKPEDLTPEELRLMADTMPGEGPGD